MANTGGASLLSSRAIMGRLAMRLEEQAPPAWTTAVGNLVKSDQASEQYAWLGMTSPLREWVGGRNAVGFTTNSITVENKTFESTLTVLVDELRRDKTAQIDLRVSELVNRASEHWAKLVTDLIVANGNCYDGTAFFGASHIEGDSGTQDNAIDLVCASGTTPDAAEMESGIIKAIETMLGFKDNTGEPMNTEARNFSVMVPPTLFSVASSALNDAVIVDGGASRTNTLVNLAGYNCSFVVNPRLTDATKFYTFRTDAAVKPFILQEETAPQISALAEGSDLEFTQDMHQYGVRVSRNVGFAYWQQAVETTCT